jgi:uncharacterized membrane protein YkoI
MVQIMLLHYIFALCVGALVVNAATATTQAQSPPERATALLSEREGNVFSLRRALAQVESRYIGQIIEVEVKPGRGYEDTPLVYELRLLTEAGHVLRIRLDALNGDFLLVEGRGLVEARRQP